MADANTYEPGPSFVENDRPEERLTEMPAWLQTFAAQEDTRDDDQSAETADDDMTTVEPEESTVPDALPADDGSAMQLPDWLTDDAGDAPEIVPELPDEPLVSFDDPDDFISASSFIDEDDLPDWLKAFSEESSVASPGPAVAPFNATRQAPSTGAVAIRVPPVENIWLPAYERKALGPGGTLFAMLASNANGSISHEDPVDSGDPAAPRDGTERSHGVMARRATPDVEGESVEAAPQRNSMRLLLLTLLIVALVILISFLFFS